MSRRRACRSGEPLPSGIGGDLAPRHVLDLPLLVLREVVEAENARVAAAVLGGVLLEGGLGAHRGDLSVHA